MSIKKYLDNLEDMTARKIIVTGGTSGIGLSTVRFLLTKNASVVILARNMKKAEEVKNDLLKAYPNAQISFIKYDQSDDKSIKEAAKEVATYHQDFYALVLNAGIMQRKKPTQYVDGYPLTIKTNYVGLALFMKELLPLLHDKHRFIFQGSLVSGLRLKKINSLKEKNISLWQQYFISKAGVEALYYHHSQSALIHEFILVEPGISITGIVRDFSPIIRFLAKMVSPLISHTPEKAALTIMKALESTTKEKSFIVPRGPFSWRGYPKIKKFSKKRRRDYLYQMLIDK